VEFVDHSAKVTEALLHVSILEIELKFATLEIRAEDGCEDSFVLYEVLVYELDFKMGA
jgi:hypothetical protein